MTWSKQHEIAMCREVLDILPFQHKYDTRDRGQCWCKSANLNKIEQPHFAVDQKAVQDRFCKLHKDFKQKKALENRASGICPDEPDELKQALEDITEMEQGQQA